MKEVRKIFNISSKNKVKKKKEDSQFSLLELIVITIAFSAICSIGTGYLVNYFTKTNILEDKELRDITDTYEKIMKEYYEEVNESDLANAAINGMMTYLDENYSIHLNDEETNDLEEKLKGNYDGIGIEVGMISSQVIITRVFDGTPASKAGIKAGDIIIDIEGVDVTKGQSLEEVVGLIKGKKEIILTVKRDKKEKSFIVKVENIDIPVVSTKVFENEDDKIGYLYLETFSSNATDQVKDGLAKLEKENINSLIIDLRGNTGGYLNTCKDIASLFLKKNKTIYSLESKDDKTHVVDTTNEHYDLPIVVLIDGATASASEILAAALKESYGAILVGTKSYGKGKVQQTNKLSDDTMIKYTTAKWFTPNGDSIDGVGLEPGITVELSLDYFKYLTDEYDNQLQKAIEILANN